MGGIFISYRREDSGPYAGRLRDTLSSHFGADQIFRDIDRINPGERFPHVIEQAVGSCDALLALIGPRWLSIKDENRQRRLDDPKDYLRQEIIAALGRDDVLVIPVLIGPVPMPGHDDLPEPLAALAEHHAVRVSDEGWDDQVARLIRSLEPVVQDVSPAPRHEPPRREPPHQPSAWQPQPFVQQSPPWQPRPAGPPPQPSSSRSAFPTGLVVAAAVLVVVAALGFAAIKAFSGSVENLDFGPGNPTVVLSPSSGPPGASVTVTGTGYAKEETIDISFHATEVGTTLAGPDGSFTAQITIPDTPFRNQQFDITAFGKQSIRNDSAPFMVE